VIRQGGEVPLDELLRVRIRYFGDGMALGSRAFIEKIFENNRDAFGSKRQRAGAPLPAGSWGKLHIMRDLRKRVYG
jgi:putative transposase